MMPVVGWRLWYGDGTTFDSGQGSWDQAPAQNVQVLEYLHEPPYRTLSYGEDEYRLTPESAPKWGKWMDEAAFHALVAEVVNG
jgi:hypothetical protein